MGLKGQGFNGCDYGGIEAPPFQPPGRVLARGEHPGLEFQIQHTIPYSSELFAGREPHTIEEIASWQALATLQLNLRSF
jgi:hypothetical protein